ncbi:hypothetical protein [Clostridium sp.]|uniref:hypothetical protein n=1 Tax=Clostridium sp. TaxID=1506 RepID=UPI003D6D0A74
MKNIVFGVISIVFFIFYFKIFILLGEWLIPINAQPIFLFILIFVIIPLSVISAQQSIKIIKES